jgi:hypothetical protein
LAGYLLLQGNLKFQTLAIAALASHYFQLSGEEKQMLFYKKKTLRLVTAMCNRALDGDLLILATYPGGALELREKIKGPLCDKNI